MNPLSGNVTVPRPWMRPLQRCGHSPCAGCNGRHRATADGLPTCQEYGRLAVCPITAAVCPC